MRGTSYTALCLGTVLGLASCAEPELERISGADGEQVDPDILGTSFADLDSNDDGFLTAEEAERLPSLRSIFSLADQNQDGRLDITEYSHATVEGTTVSPDAARGPLFLELDTDGNGRISREEAAAVPQLEANFETYDVNGSGSIDSTEYADALDEGLTPAR